MVCNKRSLWERVFLFSCGGEQIDTYFYDGQQRYVLSQRRKIKLKVSICPTVDVGVANKTPAHGQLRQNSQQKILDNTSLA